MVLQQAEVRAVVARLDFSNAMKVSELDEEPNPDLAKPGLYAWWVDAAGALQLSDGLGQTVRPGLVYVGKAEQTLRGRIVRMHARGPREGSTLRRSLGAILGARGGGESLSEEQITTWMRQHLSITIAPLVDVEELKVLEDAVLDHLDPVLNLQGRSRNEIRSRLKHLRSPCRSPVSTNLF